MLDRLALREAGRGRAVELGGRIEIVARHAVGAGHVAHGGEGAERHRVAARVAHADLEHVLRVEPVGGVRLRRHAEDAAQQVEVVDVGGAQVGLQRAEHIGHAHAQHLHLGAVDVEIELRRRRLEQREHLREAGRLRRARPSWRRRRPAAPAVRHSRGPPPSCGSRRRCRCRARAGASRPRRGLPGWRRSAGTGSPGWRRRTFFGSRARSSNGSSTKEHRARVRCVGEGRAREADEVHRVGHARHLQGDVDDLPVDRVGARERGAARQLRHDDEIARRRAAG